MREERRGDVSSSSFFETIELERFMPKIPLQASVSFGPVKTIKTMWWPNLRGRTDSNNSFDCPPVPVPFSLLALALTGLSHRGSSPRACFANCRHILSINHHRVKLIYTLLIQRRFLHVDLSLRSSQEDHQQSAVLLWAFQLRGFSQVQ